MPTSMAARHHKHNVAHGPRQARHDRPCRDVRRRRPLVRVDAPPVEVGVGLPGGHLLREPRERVHVGVRLDDVAAVPLRRHGQLVLERRRPVPGRRHARRVARLAALLCVCQAVPADKAARMQERHTEHNQDRAHRRTAASTPPPPPPAAWWLARPRRPSRRHRCRRVPSSEGHSGNGTHPRFGMVPWVPLFVS